MEYSSQSSQISNLSSQEDLNFNNQSSLSTFTIPKKKRTIDNEEFLLYNDKNEQLDELKKLKEDIRNFSDQKKNNIEELFRINSFQFVKNRKLENEFVQYKREMKKYFGDKKKNTKSNDRKAFYIADSEDLMLKVVKTGFECEKSDDVDRNILGNSEEGIHFCKHLDLALLYEYKKMKKSFYCIVVDLCYFAFGCRPIGPRNKDKEFSPDIDIFLSKELPKAAQPLQQRYWNSLMYKYDIDTTARIEKVRKRLISVQPVFVIEFKLKTINREKSTFLIDQLKQQSALIPTISVVNLENKQTNVQKKQINDIKTQFSSIELNPIYSNKNENESTQPIKAIIKSKIKVCFNNNADKRSEIRKDNDTIETETVLNDERGEKRNDNDTTETETVLNSAAFDKQTENEESQRQQFQSKTTLTSSSSSETSSSSDEEEDWFQQYESMFGEEIDSLYVKPSKWRIIYETTGRLNVKFKGQKQLSVKVNDIRSTKLKYLDQQKMSIDLKNSTNKLILVYQNKRIKKLPCLTNNSLSQSSASEITPVKNTIMLTDSVTSKSLSLTTPNQKPISQLSLPTTSTAASANLTSLKSNNNNSNTKDSKSKLKENLDFLAIFERKIKNQEQEKKKVETPISIANKKNHDQTQLITKIKQEKTESPTKPNSNSTIGLSSEMTSLEKRLLMKSKIPNTSLVSTSSKSSNSNLVNTSSSSCKIETYKSMANTNVDSIDISSKKNLNIKRKKSFWDPDSDTEYDKLGKKKYQAFVKNESKADHDNNNDKKDNDNDNDNEDEDDLNGEDDIVIVSKLNLNLPPIQYSKSYYDININAFESDLKKFSNINNSNNNHLSPSCSNSSINSNSSNLITTITKSPIKSSNANINTITSNKANNRRLSLGRNSKQRYIHHIVTSYAINTNLPPPSISNTDLISQQFDVDNLIKLKSNNKTESIVKSSNSTIEIHAGGFNCIEEHKFQRTITYLRRTQSFNIMLNDFDEISNPNNLGHLNNSHSFSNLKLLQQNELSLSQQSPSNSNKNKISLNDYKSKSVSSNLNLQTNLNSNDSESSLSQQNSQKILTPNDLSNEIQASNSTLLSSNNNNKTIITRNDLNQGNLDKHYEKEDSEIIRADKHQSENESKPALHEINEKKEENENEEKNKKIQENDDDTNIGKNYKRKKKHHKKKMVSLKKRNRKKLSSINSSSSSMSISSSSSSDSLSSLLSSSEKSDDLESSKSSDMSISNDEKVVTKENKIVEKINKDNDLEEEEEGEINDSDDDDNKDKSKYLDSVREFTNRREKDNKFDNHRHKTHKKRKKHHHRHPNKDEESILNESNNNKEIKESKILISPSMLSRPPPPILIQTPQTQQILQSLPSSQQSTPSLNTTITPRFNRPPPQIMTSITPSHIAKNFNINNNNNKAQNVNNNNNKTMNRIGNQMPHPPPIMPSSVVQHQSPISNLASQTGLLPTPTMSLSASNPITNLSANSNFQDKKFNNNLNNTPILPSKRFNQASIQANKSNNNAQFSNRPQSLNTLTSKDQPNFNSIGSSATTVAATAAFNSFFSTMTNNFVDSNLNLKFDEIAKNFENTLNQMTLTSSNNNNTNTSNQIPPVAAKISSTNQIYASNNISHHRKFNANNNINNTNFYDDSFSNNEFSSHILHNNNTSNNNNNTNNSRENFNRYNGNNMNQNYQQNRYQSNQFDPSLNYNQQQQRPFPNSVNTNNNNNNQRFNRSFHGNNNSFNNNNNNNNNQRYNNKRMNNSFNNNYNFNNKNDNNNDQEDGEIL